MPGPFYFAWVGGAIDSPLLLATRGDTHGAILSSVTTTGDLTAGNPRILNLADPGQLVEGSLYGITGLGIPPGDTFVYLGGNQIQLSQPPQITQTNVSLTMTQAVAVLTTTGSTSAAGQFALDSVNGLVVGQLYGIAGFGISPGATFVFQGSASIHPTPGATNTASAVVLTISTVIGAGAFVVDNIAGLTGTIAGATYNITGPGIPGGTGFVAPAGGNSIILDQAATATAVNVPLTITGPRVADGGAFNNAADLRMDEQIISLVITQEEGNFATLEIEIRNPARGLLTPGRQIWCWLSWDDGTGNVIPLFHGRLVGVPADLAGEVVRLEFIAKPNDYAAQKETLAEAMRVLPYWDPIWLSDKVFDADTVLETRSQLWHVDRVSLAVTASDIIAGEDGTLQIGEGQHSYDQLEVSYGQPPMTSIAMTGTVSWIQQGDGDLDLTQTLFDAFKQAGSPYRYPLIATLTGDGHKSTWPAAGRVVGSGWKVSDSSSPLTEATWVQIYKYRVRYVRQAAQVSPAVTPPPIIIGGVPAPPQPSVVQTTPPQLPSLASQFMNPWNQVSVDFPMSVFSLTGATGVFNFAGALLRATGAAGGTGFSLTYSASRKRTERVSFTMLADIQGVLTDAAGENQDTLDLTSETVGEAIDLGGGLPIGDLRRKSYFQTDRGARSFEFLLLLARAKLLARARGVDIKFGMPWKLGTGLSCRYNVQLTDRRLPGGSAIGKVKKYALIFDGRGQRAEVTIGCTVGHGSTVAAQAGHNTYADNYDSGYEVSSGIEVAIASSDLVYQSLDDFEVVDDGLDLFNMTPENCVLNLNSNLAPVSLLSTGDVSLTTIVDNLASVAGLIIGNDYAITGPGIPINTTATYDGGFRLTLSRAATQARRGAPLHISSQAVNGILQGGPRDQISAINSGTRLTGSGYSDPITALSNTPTVITLDLVPLQGSEFTTEFVPAVSALMVPKTIDLEAA